MLPVGYFFLFYFYNLKQREHSREVSRMSTRNVLFTLRKLYSIINRERSWKRSGNQKLTFPERKIVSWAAVF